MSIGIPYLHSGFSQADLHGEFLSHEDIGIAGLLESLLELLQLLCSEVGAMAPLLASAVGFGTTLHHGVVR